MAKVKLCKVCHVRPAAVPDRNSGTLSPRKEVCRECHSNRLADDLKFLLDRRSKAEG